MFNEHLKQPEELAPIKEILIALLNDVTAFQEQMTRTSEYAQTLVTEFTALQQKLKDKETEEDHRKLVELQAKFHETRVQYAEAAQALEHLQETWQALTILGTPEAANA